MPQSVSACAPRSRRRRFAALLSAAASIVLLASGCGSEPTAPETLRTAGSYQLVGDSGVTGWQLDVTVGAEVIEPHAANARRSTSTGTGELRRDGVTTTYPNCELRRIRYESGIGAGAGDQLTLQCPFANASAPRFFLSGVVPVGTGTLTSVTMRGTVQNAIIVEGQFPGAVDGVFRMTRAR